MVGSMPEQYITTEQTNEQTTDLLVEKINKLCDEMEINRKNIHEIFEMVERIEIINNEIRESLKKS